MVHSHLTRGKEKAGNCIGVGQVTYPEYLGEWPIRPTGSLAYFNVDVSCQAARVWVISAPPMTVMSVVSYVVGTA
jgi:hypothetical protein